MIQKTIVLFTFILLCAQLKSQDQYATIDLSDFWVDSLSYISYGEADTDKLLFNAGLGDLTAFKVKILEGFSNSMHLKLSLEIGSNTYVIELDNGQLLDESSSVISVGSITNLDEFYLAVDGNDLYYYHNTTLLLQKSISISANVVAYLESFFDLSAKAYFYLEGAVEGTGDFAGFIHKPDTFPLNMCSPDQFYIGIPNVSISIENLSEQTTTVINTDSEGAYTAALTPGMLSVTPTRNFDDITINSITVFDALLIQGHANQNNIIECPIKRIASDVNFDGKIDTTDANLVTDLILGNEDTINGPIWRYIPKAYTYPSTGHPDYNFVNNFWNSSVADVQGRQYPFAAELRFNGKNYHYLGANSWMEKVHEWPFGSEEACGEVNWGFYTVKVGDVNDNLDISSIQNFTEGQEAVNLRMVYSNGTRSVTNSISTRSNAARYRLSVSAKSRQQIQCYQLGLRIDPNNLEIVQLRPERDRLEQTEERNYGNRRGQFNEGILRHVWLSKPQLDDSGFLAPAGQLLFEVEIQARENFQVDQESFSQYIFLDPAVLPTRFYSNDRVNRQVELVIELEEL